MHATHASRRRKSPRCVPGTMPRTASRRDPWFVPGAKERPSRSLRRWATGFVGRGHRVGSVYGVWRVASGCRRVSSRRSRPAGPSHRSAPCTPWPTNSGSPWTSCCSSTRRRRRHRPSNAPEPAAIEVPRDPVQRARSRVSIRLGSGVVWERLTTESLRNVDFLFVTYEVGGGEQYVAAATHRWLMTRDRVTLCRRLPDRSPAFRSHPQAVALILSRHTERTCARLLAADVHAAGRLPAPLAGSQPAAVRHQPAMAAHAS